MNRYTGLSGLYVNNFSTVSWPSTSISQTVMVSFLEWAFKLKNSDLTFGGLSGETWLMNVWHSFQGTESEVSVKFMEPIFSLVSNATFKLNLNQTRNDHHTSVSSAVEFIPGDDREAEFIPGDDAESRAKASLTDLQENVQKVAIDMRATEFEIGDYINSLLSISRQNLKLEVCGGRLHQYSGDYTQSKGGRYVKSLIFDETNIDKECLSSLLSSHFPNLDLLELRNCNISGSNDNGRRQVGNSKVRFIFPKTAVGSLSISNCNINKHSTLLISVFSTDQNIGKYYIDINSTGTYLEISQKYFDAFKHELKAKNMGIISVIAKSIKTVQLSVYLESFQDFCQVELEIY